jgi:uncharacterized protein
MRIGVISDTHGQIPASVADHFMGVDEIWHLGDVCDPSVLSPLDELGVPLKLVRGNCDNCMDWPLVLDLQRGGLRFHLEHIPPRQAPHGCQILLHGHTHAPRDEMVGGVRWLNPGTAGKPNKGHPSSVAVIEIADGGVLEWRLIRLG